jgi:anti-sigma B factor antagonist
MSSYQSRLRIKKIDEITRVEFIDRNILDEGNIQAIGDEITEVIDAESCPRLLISFANVDHLSSSALGTLITISRRVKNRGGELRLSDIDPQIYDVFVITRLNKIFDIHDTSDDALKSFQKS